MTRCSCLQTLLCGFSLHCSTNPITCWHFVGCGKEMPLSFQPIICFTMAQITKILQVFVLWGSSVTDKDNFTDTWTENFHIWYYSSLKSVNSCIVMLHVVTYHKYCEFQGCINQSACLSKLKERMVCLQMNVLFWWTFLKIIHLLYRKQHKVSIGTVHRQLFIHLWSVLGTWTTASQYKHFKNFSNLCIHEADYRSGISLPHPKLSQHVMVLVEQWRQTPQRRVCRQLHLVTF